MTVEREIKLVAPDELRVPDLSDLGIRLHGDETIEQVATYYDTPDLRLTRAGASLRYRSDDGWTVKLAPPDADDHGLARDEHRFTGGPAVPPSAALDLVAALVRTARVAPVARLVTRRNRRMLVTDDLRPIGELVDDRVTVLGTATGGFRELEVELADAAPVAAVEAIVARLRAGGAQGPDPTPKIVRALGPRASEPPDVGPVSVPRPPTVDAVIRHALADAVARLVAHDPGVRLGTDIEAVHQARVATRRLRSHLRTFRNLLDRVWATGLRDELRWLGAELGAVRDPDVQLARLRRRVEDLIPDDRVTAAPLLARHEEQRATARSALLDGLRSTRYLALLDRLVEATQRPRVVLMAGIDHDQVLRDLVRAPWQHLRRAVDALPDDPSDAQLHEVRIRAKRARYAAEVVEPAFGKPARAFARALTVVQDVLGEHQDAVIAAAWLRDAAMASADPKVSFVAGELVAREEAAARAARAAWPEAWRRASTRKLRAWL